MKYEMNPTELQSPFAIGRKSILLLSLTYACLIGCSDVSQIKSLESYLSEKYEIESIEIDAQDQIVYYKKDHPPTLKQITAKLLERKTGHNFYSATLNTFYLEYQHLPTVFAVPQPEPQEVKALMSPTIIDPNPEFIRIFENIPVNTEEEKWNLPEQISYLFAIITQAGKIQNMEKHG